uniref:beta strand repeat-containing protein n=1 Tax=Pedobacter heparinus TaxID=984 RepID=UPI002931A326
MKKNLLFVLRVLPVALTMCLLNPGGLRAGAAASRTVGLPTLGVGLAFPALYLEPDATRVERKAFRIARKKVEINYASLLNDAKRHSVEVKAFRAANNFSVVPAVVPAVVPTDSNFDSPVSAPYEFITPESIGGATFSLVAPAGKKSTITAPTGNISITSEDVGKPYGYDLALIFNIDSSNVLETGPLDARITSTDGSEFRIVSMEVDTGAGLGTSPNLTVTGYRDGVSVASDVINTGSSDSSGSVTYTKNGVSLGYGGVLTFNTAWQYIDEIRFTGTTTVVAIDDMNFEPAVVSTPTITSATYNASTGVIAVTGTNFTATGGATNDVVANKFTLTGEGGVTYTLTDTPNVEIGSATTFSLTLSATDSAAINQIVNKNGTSSTGLTTYNLAGAAGFIADSAATADLTGNGITASSVGTPSITSATYDASTGVLVVTGTNLKTLNGATNDIVANKFTLRGEGGSTYLLTDTPNANITSGTSFTLTLSATDKAGANLLLNKNGTLSTDISTYNLAAAEDWAAGADAAVLTADTTGNGVTVSNVAVPTITSATYDASTGTLVVTGTGLLKRSGATNDIVANKFTLRGEGGSTYTLTNTANVEVTSGTRFTLILSATDKAGVNLILNKNGALSTDISTYNLAAAEDWAAGANAAVVVADTNGNGVTVSNVAIPTITSATYDANTGSLVVTGTGLLKRSGANNDILANKFTFTGEGGSTYTLTNTSSVEVASVTSFTLTLSVEDKDATNLLLNKNGASSTGGTTYNLAADEDWARGTDAAVVDADVTGNGIIVSNVPVRIISVTSNASNGSYGVGPVAIAVDVNFSADVDVTGTPQLTLETGTTDRDVNYSSGSGSSTLKFTYIIQAGDNSQDLDYTSTAALALNSGTINATTGGTAAILTLPAPGASGSLASNTNIIIDTQRPTATVVVADNALTIGETSLVTITFSEAVTGFNNTDLSINNGNLTAVS